jgi:hypothetical protein
MGSLFFYYLFHLYIIFVGIEERRFKKKET